MIFTKFWIGPDSTFDLSPGCRWFCRGRRKDKQLRYLDPQDFCEAFQFVERRSTLAPFDQIEEIERDVCFLGQPLLRQFAGQPNLSQSGSETRA